MLDNSWLCTGYQVALGVNILKFVQVLSELPICNIFVLLWWCHKGE